MDAKSPLIQVIGLTLQKVTIPYGNAICMGTTITIPAGIYFTFMNMTARSNSSSYCALSLRRMDTNGTIVEGRIPNTYGTHAMIPYDYFLVFDHGIQVNLYGAKAVNDGDAVSFGGTLYFVKIR